MKRLIMNTSYSKIRHIQEANQRLEKRLMTEQQESTESNEPLDEQWETLKNLGRKVVQSFAPDVKSLRSTLLKDLARINAPESIKNLLTKFSYLKLTNFVKQVLRPVENEVVILANDAKRLQQFAIPVQKGQANYVAFLDQGTKVIKDELRGVNDAVRMDILYTEMKHLQEYIAGIEKNKLVSQEGMTILNAMKQNADDAVKNMETALSQIAVRK